MTVFAVKRKLTGITIEGLGEAQQAAIDKYDEFSLFQNIFDTFLKKTNY